MRGERQGTTRNPPFMNRILTFEPFLTAGVRRMVVFRNGLLYGTSICRAASDVGPVFALVP